MEQWSTFIENSPLLFTSLNAETSNPSTSEVISINTPHAAKTESGLYFYPRNTSSGLVITISNPNKSDIAFLQRVCKELGGILVGDEGEKY